jgi:hypothetical protein
MQETLTVPDKYTQQPTRSSKGPQHDALLKSISTNKGYVQGKAYT